MALVIALKKAKGLNDPLDVSQGERRTSAVSEDEPQAKNAGRSASAEQQPEAKTWRWLRRTRLRRYVFGRWVGLLGTHVFSSLTRRILVLNLVGLLVMVSGILYLNQFRAGLIDARVQSLLTQGEIIAGAIAANATTENDALMVDPEQLLRLEAGESVSPRNAIGALDFPINPELVGPILRRLISPTRTRARIYDPEGVMLLDSRQLYSYNQIFRFDLPPPDESERNLLTRWGDKLKLWMRRGEYPVYKELGRSEGRDYPEVAAALSGSPASVVRLSSKGEMIVSVAVPVQRFRGVLGALLLSTQGGDIDDIVAAERSAIIKVFVVVAVVVMVMSVLMAGTIAGPMRRLSEAAKRVQNAINSREEIPLFPDRRDEIGDLARAFRNMTKSLYERMDAIESFAADVAHELKNPLTSLRSAVETLPLAKTDASRERLLEVIQHDVCRLDRLITDISEASRIDAEMARAETGEIDLKTLITTLVDVANERCKQGAAFIQLQVDDESSESASSYMVAGADTRLSQVLNNLLDNARSFSPPDRVVTLHLSRQADQVVFTVEDEGPGLRPDVMERVFERFYTDRPESEGFGNNSGLGLSICKQIVEAHRGTITASNRYDDDNQKPLGACFSVKLPALKAGG
ncbi:stimulus-sensing domain-containing protein [Polycladidibacter hongkongensis]|uniref:stimulus-sensing domain-containing protein n=1 Tax=Polycladidibacter hongkongensis TaxID=1647556 RepID=UPI0009EAD281|nr:stimulus-sensing domain-containing protein [Pseudovibrio hongkongensis]